MTALNHSGRNVTLSEEKMLPRKSKDLVEAGILVENEPGEVVNASGHRDQLQRQYGLLSICGLALTIDNAWVALGGSITVSICMSPALLLSQRESMVLMELQTMVDHRASCMNCLSHASITASLPHPLRRYMLISPRFPSPLKPSSWHLQSPQLAESTTGRP